MAQIEEERENEQKMNALQVFDFIAFSSTARCKWLCVFEVPMAVSARKHVQGKRLNIVKFGASDQTMNLMKNSVEIFPVARREKCYLTTCLGRDDAI